jgi:Uma2 family endonuclease
MSRKPTPTEKRVMLSGVSWQQFETLLDELGTNRTTRMTYDRGKLEMMTPLEEHHRCARLLESLILVLGDEVRSKVYSLGSVLLTRPDAGRAIQPESAYYFDQAMQVQENAELDMNRTEPPALIADIAITKGKMDRFSLYGSMGVPEIWCYTTVAGDDVLKGKLQILQLQGDRYIESSSSAQFPFLPATRVLEFLEQSDSLGLAQALVVLRDWMRKRL